MLTLKEIEIIKQYSKELKMTKGRKKALWLANYFSPTNVDWRSIRMSYFLDALSIPSSEFQEPTAIQQKRTGMHYKNAFLMVSETGVRPRFVTNTRAFVGSCRGKTGWQ